MSIRIRDEAGIGLVELLVATTIMSIGIFAIVAGFSSGIETNRRASKTSTAGTLADRQMEAYRRGAYASIAAAGAQKPGPDSRTYWVESFVTPATVCSDGALDSTIPMDCGANGGIAGREVKTVTIEVHDGPTAIDPATSQPYPLLITETTTFDRSTG